MILKEADERHGDIAVLSQLMEHSSGPDKDVIAARINGVYADIQNDTSSATILGRAYASNPDSMLISDLRLSAGAESAWIDHVVIDLTMGCAWIIAADRHGETVTCDRFGDWSSWISGRSQEIPSPIPKAERNASIVRKALRLRKMTSIRTVVPVVMLSPASRLETKWHDLPCPVIRSHRFASWHVEQKERHAIVEKPRHDTGDMRREEIIVAWRQIVDDHDPYDKDWTDILGLKSRKDGRNGIIRMPNAFRQVDEPAAGISTRHGRIAYSRLPDGRYALKHDRSYPLEEAVRQACSGIGQWNPRYRNWILSETRLASFEDRVTKK